MRQASRLDQVADILEKLSSWLGFQQRLGLEAYPNTPAIEQFLRCRPHDAREPSGTGDASGTARPGPNREGTEGFSPRSLAETRTLLGECRRCRLSEGRHSIVFGEGPEDARLVLVGEAPGREEDSQGRPFVGASGELLTKMLRAIQISRDEVYITSVIKCRPPKNRTPSAGEIEACVPFLRHQIHVIQPALILALGQVAAQTLLGEQSAVKELRGRFHECLGARLMVTYHPAYILRFGGDRQKTLKREAWIDLQTLERAYVSYR